MTAELIRRMDDNLLYKLIDDGGCQFPDTHIFPYNGCKAVKVGSILFKGFYHFLPCLNLLCQFSLFRFIISGEFQEPLIDALENAVKFSNAFFRLGDFTLAFLSLFFGFLEVLLFRGFLKCHSIIKEQRRHIENPLQNKQFQRFFPDEVHGTVACIALIPGTPIAVLLRRHVFACSEMQFASAIGAVQQARKQPLPFSLLGRTALVLPQFLYPHKDLFINNGRLCIGENPLVFRDVMQSLFQFVGLGIGLEVHCTAGVLRTFQYSRHRFRVPVIRFFRQRFSGTLGIMCLDSQDTFGGQQLGNLHGAFSRNAQVKNTLDDLGSFLVHNPLLFVRWVFHIPVGRVGAEVFPSVSFGTHDGTDFLAGIARVEVVEHRLLGKGKANRQKSSIHAGLRRDGSQKLTSQKTDYCTITYRF